MAQPQPHITQRTFSPVTQMPPSSISHPGTPFANQPPSKKPRLSPAPSPQGLTHPGNASFPPYPANGVLGASNSPTTPGTPNSLASSTPPNMLATGGLPMPSTSSPSTASPIPTAAPPPYNAMANGVHNNGAPPMQLPAAPPQPQSSQAFSPRAATQTAALSPLGPPAGSGPPLPQIAPAPAVPPSAAGANVFSPMAASPSVQMAPGIMGPPSKPPDRPTKEYQYDVDDSLAGTGIDLRQEEQFQADYFAGSFRPEARTGFPANTPGRRGSFYGALVANQVAQTAAEVDQRKAATALAKERWEESAKTLAVQRSNALRNPFLELNVLHARAEKIAREYGVGVILDPKPSAGGAVRLRQDTEFPQPRVTVSTKTGPDGVSLVSTTGTFLPEDTYLADQFALLALATRHRLRELLEDANKAAVTRQRTSHGVIPDEWADAAVPLASKGDGDANGVRSNPLKRPHEPDSAKDSEAGKSAVNTLAQSLRIVGKEERDWEEKRLLKRQKREGKLDVASTTGTPRSGTPGPGSVAPEPDKPVTKKELKRNAAAKVTEQNDTLSANRTSMAFLGGRKKQYSWMSGGGGASTPKRGGGGGGGLGGGGTPGGTPGAGPGMPGGGGGAAGAAGGGNAGGGRRPGEPMMLTGEGRTRLGTWREDGPKGQDIQLRDWVVVLETDGRETVALQQAYSRLDGPGAKTVV